VVNAAKHRNTSIPVGAVRGYEGRECGLSFTDDVDDHHLNPNAIRTKPATANIRR
jgi:hypothetical protein